MQNTFKVKGTYKFQILDKEGKLRDSWTVDNLVVSAGLAELANLTGGVSTPTAFTYIAVGSNDASVTAGQTTLSTEITGSGLARKAGTVSRQETNVANDTYQITATWTATGSVPVEEVGVFNDATTGVMLSRALTGTKALDEDETLIGTYQLVFANA